jgi:hypothetical protein
MILGTFGTLVAITTVLLFCARRPDPTLEWLPPQAIARGGALGKLDQLTASIKSLTAPIWRPFTRKPRPITIRSSLMWVMPGDLALAGLGSPISTNANGARAWVLDPDKLRAFVPPLNAMNDSHALMMFDGGRASMASSSFIIMSSTNVALGRFQLSYAPKIVSEGIRVDVGVTSAPMAGGTNLASIRARIPTAGALLLDCPAATAGGGRHYLFIFTPTIPPPATTLATSPNTFRPAGAYSTTPPHSFQ